MNINSLVDAATSETNTSEDWATIIDVCERADESESAADEIVSHLSKRIMHKNVNVVLFSLTLANSLLQNCGKNVRKALSSRIFVDSLLKQLADKKVHGTAKFRILDLIQQWADMYKGDEEMGYLVGTYTELKRQNYQFPKPHEPEKNAQKEAADIQKKKEDEELELALALSLSTVSDVKQDSAGANRELFVVKALYDFPGYEEGELPLSVGQVIKVYDDTTFHDWWKGEVNGKVGIFPSNYVQKIQDLASSGDVHQASFGINQSDEAFVLENALWLDKFQHIVSTFDHNSSMTENRELQDIYSKILSLRPRILNLLHHTYYKSDELNYVYNRYNSALVIFHRLMNMYGQDRNMANRYDLNLTANSTQYSNYTNAQYSNTANAPYPQGQYSSYSQRPESQFFPSNPGNQADRDFY